MFGQSGFTAWCAAGNGHPATVRRRTLRAPDWPEEQSKGSRHPVLAEGSSA